jgi:polyisoprenoid-binding protein YceI
MVTKVRGSFNEFEGSGYFDADDPAGSRLALTIQAASIDTRNADRDGHLRSNDFFDMETYPEITFASTAVEPLDAENYRVTGDLTIKGVTKPVAVDLEYTGAALDPFGNQRVGFEGKTVVNRKDWGVNWNAALEAGGVLVSEKVTLEFEVSAIRTGDAA